MRTFETRDFCEEKMTYLINITFDNLSIKKSDSDVFQIINYLEMLCIMIVLKLISSFLINFSRMSINHRLSLWIKLLLFSLMLKSDLQCVKTFLFTCQMHKRCLIIKKIVCKTLINLTSRFVIKISNTDIFFSLKYFWNVFNIQTKFFSFSRVKNVKST